MLRFLGGLVVCLGLYLSPTGAGFAQPGKQLAVDDPELYSSFFFFMEDFSGWLDSRGAANPAAKTKLMQSAARYLKVNVNELPNVTASCRSAAANLRQISVDARGYQDGEAKNGRAPDVAMMAQFEAKRQAAIQSGTAQLKQTLSAASWNGLHSHINGEHRASQQMLAPAFAPPSPPHP